LGAVVLPASDTWAGGEAWKGAVVSLESWRAEFYPVPAPAATDSDEEAIAHSLRKWEGALPDNLAKHGVLYTDAAIRDGAGGIFDFDSDSCALCEAHPWCEKCPVAEEQEGPCDEDSAYHMSVDDPLPMITLLRKVNADRGGK
jgi:hypothetical protein